jgi:hypothetical protein
LGLAISVAWVADDCPSLGDGGGCDGGKAATIAGTTAVLGIGVGLIGAGIGALLGGERWEEVPLDRLRVSFAPRRDGFALGLSVSF